MKRDNDLIRDILLKVEDASQPLTLDTLEIEDFESGPVAYHVQLLDEAGYIHAIFNWGDDIIQQAIIERLTWQGHEFLDSVRDDTTWSHTKSTIASTVGSASFEVVKALATSFTLRALGLAG